MCYKGTSEDFCDMGELWVPPFGPAHVLRRFSLARSQEGIRAH
jgi:hypothetical protein